MRRIFSLLLAVALFVGCFAGMNVVSAANRYQISETGINFIKTLEGFTPYAVLDNTQYSIGYGTACGKYEYPNGISQSTADYLLRNSLVDKEKKLNDFLVSNNIPLGQEQYDALISFTYNVGISWLKDSRLATLLKEGNFGPSDFASAMGVWCHVGKSISNGLLLRRVRETQLFFYNDYTGKNSPQYVYVQFDAAGGKMLTDIYFYPQGSAYGMLQTATKENTKFLGWFKSDGTQLTEKSIAMDNLRVTARWQNPHPASQAFSDISASAWYYGYVDDLYNGGVINGYTDGTFRPQGNVTVGEALKMIFIAAGYPAQTPVATDAGQWASGYRALAITLEIIDPDEYKNLNVSATRELIAKVAAMALKLDPVTESEEIFADTTDPYVLALYRQDILQGSFAADGKRYYKPQDHITRAEISAVVSRIMNT